MSTNLTYSYTKLRKNFGKQPMFSSVKEHLLDSIAPDKAEQRKYILRNPVNSECQAYIKKNEAYINTKRVIYENTGVNHAEGGWPKDINFNDEELTTRHRRRIERDESYIEAVLGTYHKLSKCINQNNAIELYDMFFKHMAPVQPVERTSMRLSNMYKDPEQRPISSLSWSFEEDPKLVVAYCDTRFPVRGPQNQNLSCAVWCLENPNEPAYVLSPPSACWQAICSPANPSLIIAGLADGRVCIFDIRSKQEAEVISPAHLAHRDPVSALVYMQSRLNLEFFSGSTDGACMWWDVRNITQITDYFTMSVKVPPGSTPDLSNAEPVTSLQYERAFPSKFLCGTDTGLLIGINRKGKTHKEMVTAVFEAHRGAVKAVHRSPCVSKMILTCGDWTAHLWSEEVTTSPIVTGTPGQYQISDVAWAPQRLSSYMTVGGDGVFRYWDLLRSYRHPVQSLQLSKDSLSKVKPQEEGRVIAVADSKGIVYVLSLSENLVTSADADKQLVIQLYERETHRERILENRVKEIRLKQAAAPDKVGIELVVEDEVAVLKQAEEDFRKFVAEEVRRTGYSVQSSARRGVKTR